MEGFNQECNSADSISVLTQIRITRRFTADHIRGKTISHQPASRPCQPAVCGLVGLRANGFASRWLSEPMGTPTGGSVSRWVHQPAAQRAGGYDSRRLRQPVGTPTGGSESWRRFTYSGYPSVDLSVDPKGRFSDQIKFLIINFVCC